MASPPPYLGINPTYHLPLELLVVLKLIPVVGIAIPNSTLLELRALFNLATLQIFTVQRLSNVVHLVNALPSNLDTHRTRQENVGSLGRSTFPQLLLRFIWNAFSFRLDEYKEKYNSMSWQVG